MKSIGFPYKSQAKKIHAFAQPSMMFRVALTRAEITQLSPNKVCNDTRTPQGPKKTNYKFINIKREEWENGWITQKSVSHKF